MKQLSTIVSILAISGVIATSMSISSCNSEHKNAVSDTNNTPPAAEKIAYVNIDTLQEYYTYFQDKKSELEKRHEAMSRELKLSQQKFQSDYLKTQRKAQAGTLTQAEYQSAVKKLTQMQQTLEARDASLTDQFLKEQNDFNKGLKKRVDDFLIEYNKDKGYDFIFSYGEGLPVILLANPTKDITQDLIKGMNEDYAADKENGDKEEKK